jgi:cytochrome c oxidase subunit 3
MKKWVKLQSTEIKHKKRKEILNARITNIMRTTWTKHQFHLVDSSQLPILTAISVMLMVLSVVFRWHPSSNTVVLFWDQWILTHISFIMFTVALLSWFISVVRESNAGYHTRIVQKGLKLGMLLFIVSEVLFFFAFFWAFFHFSLAPSVFIGCVWPPKGTQPIDPWGLPLVNTLLLLSSGITITLAHHAILKSTLVAYRKIFVKYLFCTIVLGVIFLLCQAIEYKYGIAFSWKDNVYGSIFFVTTGFHGFHVTFGTLFLCFCLVRDAFYLLVNKPYGLFFAIAYHFYAPLIKKVIHLDQKWKNVKTLEFVVIHPYAPPFTDPSDPLFKGWNIRVFRELMHSILFLLPTKMARKLVYRTRPTTYTPSQLNNMELTLKIIKRVWQKDVSSPTQHLGFEAAAWYWHFVDVVWLFLFVTIYWWGS